MDVDPRTENSIYKQVAEEIAAGEFSPGPWAKACDKAKGDRKLAESLYINYRFSEISGETASPNRRKKSRKEIWRRELSDFLALPSPQLLALLAVLAIVVLLGTCKGLLR